MNTHGPDGMVFLDVPAPRSPPTGPCHRLPPLRGTREGPDRIPPAGAFARTGGHFTGFHTPHPSVVNCPSDDRIVTVITRADVAKLLSMMSPDSDVRSQ